MKRNVGLPCRKRAGLKKRNHGKTRKINFVSQNDKMFWQSLPKNQHDVTYLSRRASALPWSTCPSVSRCHHLYFGYFWPFINHFVNYFVFLNCHLQILSLLIARHSKLFLPASCASYHCSHQPSPRHRRLRFHACTGTASPDSVSSFI